MKSKCVDGLAWHYCLLEYKQLIACPHPHAAPVKSKRCCRCSHGSILDHQLLPPKSSWAILITPPLTSEPKKSGHLESLATHTHTHTQANKKGIENGYHVSMKLPDPPHGKPKKIFFARLPWIWLCQHLSANLQCNPFTINPSKS